MQILIHRYSTCEVTCDGILSINGINLCSTAENSKYRIPVGTYRIIIRHSKLHGRRVPMIVPLDTKEPLPKTLPCLCVGNGIYNLKDGSIILGKFIVPGCLKHSYLNFKLIYDRINNNMRRRHEVTLKITESS